MKLNFRVYARKREYAALRRLKKYIVEAYASNGCTESSKRKNGFKKSNSV